MRPVVALGRRGALVILCVALASCTPVEEPPPDPPPEGLRVAVDAGLNRVYALVRGPHPGGGDVYIDFLAIVDGRTGSLAHLVPVDEGFLDINALEVDPISHRVFLPRVGQGGPFTKRSPEGFGCVTVLDGRSGKLITRRRVPRGFGAGAVLDPRSRRLFGAPNGSDRPYVLAADAIRPTFRVRVDLDPPFLRAMDVDSRKGLFFIAADSPGTLIVIDANRNQTVARIPLGKVTPHDVDVDERTGRAYVSDEEDPFVHIVDLGRERVLKRLLIEDLGYYHVAVNPRTGRAYVSDSSGFVTVIDGLRIMKSILIGGRLSDVTVDPSRNRIYVIDELGLLSTIDGRTSRVTSRIDLGAAAKRAAARRPSVELWSCS